MTSEGGLIRYNGKRCYTFDNHNLKDILSPRFYRFTKTVSGRILALSRSATEFLITDDAPVPKGARLPVEDRQFILSFYNCNDKNAPGSHSTINDTALINAFPFANRKVYWVNNTDYIIGGDPGIYYVAGGKITHQYLEKGIKQLSFFESSNNLYALTVNGSAYQIKQSPFKVTKLEVDPVFYSPGIKLFLSSHSETPLLMKGDSLFKLQVISGKVSAQLFAIIPAKIPDITAITINPNNKEIYFGTATNGLYVFTKSNFYTYYIPEEYIHRKLNIETISHGFNNVYSTLLFSDNKYALTNEGILFNLDDGTFEQPPNQNESAFKKLASLRDANFERPASLNLHYSTNYKITDRSFLWRINPSDRFNLKTDFTDDRRFVLKRLDTKELFHFSQEKGAGKTVWACSKNSFGYCSGDTVHKVSDLSWLPDSLKKPDLINLNVIGPLSKTLFLLSVDNHFFSLDTATFVLKKVASLPNIPLRSTILHNTDFCWISTYGLGYFLLDINAGKFYTGPMDSRNYLLYPHTFATDGMGNLLIPTNKGLFRTNESHLVELCKNPGNNTLLYEYYTIRNGLKGIEFNGGCIPAFNRLPNGDILFPSLNGLVRVFVSSFQSEKKYPVYIESVSSRSKIHPYTNDIRLQANERTLTWQLNFAQWSEIYSGNILYRLDNSSEWLRAESATNTIVLTELNGGNHSIQIKVLYDLEGKERSLSSFRFYVEKRYYEKAGFWVLVILAITGLIFLASYFRSYQTRKKNIQLEKKVKEKTELLEEKNTRLEETLNEVTAMMSIIREKSEFQKKLIRIIGHDVMVPLQFIAKTARQLAVYKDKLSTELRDETTAEINTTSTGLMYLGQSIIQWIKLQENSFKIDATDFEVLSSLQEIIPLHVKLLNAKNNKLDTRIEPNLRFYYNPHAFRIIIHNLVMNANKFTAGGVIRVKCDQRNEQMIIEVTDTGMGMDPQIAENLNNMKAVSPSIGLDTESGWGLGYKVIIELVKASSGTLKISSEKGNGTIVKITLLK